MEFTELVEIDELHLLDDEELAEQLEFAKADGDTELLDALEDEHVRRATERSKGPFAEPLGGHWSL